MGVSRAAVGRDRSISATRGDRRMPTRDRLQRVHDADEVIDLAAAGERANYAPDYLRTLIWRAPVDPPPLFKRRGRWVVRVGDLDEWLERRA
jgi:hypothetical protein